MVELRKEDEADRMVAEAEAAGTRKGLTFEERIHDAVERIARSRGDSATHTGGEQAEGGGRKGDTLIELDAAEGPSAGRMVFEAKDKKLSKNQAWAELNEGMAARAASYAILVVAGEERVPAGREPLHEYEGNKLIVAVDREQPDGLALETAYRLAAARVKRTAASSRRPRKRSSPTAAPPSIAGACSTTSVSSTSSSSPTATTPSWACVPAGGAGAAAMLPGRASTIAIRAAWAVTPR